MARVLRGFAPEPPVVFVILSEVKYFKLTYLDYPLSQPPPWGGELMFLLQRDKIRMRSLLR